MEDIDINDLKKIDETSSFNPDGIELEGEIKEDGKVLFHVKRESMVSFSGPLPHPSTLEDYEKVLPGSAERILKMAEKQQDHRIELERALVTNDLRNRTLSSFFAFVLTLTVIVIGGILLYVGKSVSGFVSLIAGLVPLVGLFYNKNIKEDEDDDKN